MIASAEKTRIVASFGPASTAEARAAAALAKEFDAVEIRLDSLVEPPDFGALRAGYVSITPLELDLTHYKAMDVLKKWKF